MYQYNLTLSRKFCNGLPLLLVDSFAPSVHLMLPFEHLLCTVEQQVRAKRSIADSSRRSSCSTFIAFMICEEFSMSPYRRLIAGIGLVALIAFSALMIASSVGAQGQKIKNAVPDLAHPLPLSAVRLTGGPLKVAQDQDAAYLLKLEADRMMAFYRQRAGLEAKAQGYTGWDGDGRNLTGHIAGHYLSAVSLMYASTGDVRFKERADYLVREMKEVQDKHGDGYLGALANGKEQFIEVSKGNIRSAGFDLNGLWAPWYVLHKTYAGLRDAYRLTGNRTALEIEVKFAGWAEGILAKLDDAQTQKMLNTEFGGMPEVLADLYADTGDKRPKAARLAHPLYIYR
jgi:hypothetical protein